jgi:cysteine desulfurase
MKVYLDNAATTTISTEVHRSMIDYYSKNFGNSSSIHEVGRIAKEALEKSRETIAKKISSRPSEIVFTSGGTESNNLTIKGIALAHKKGHIITSKIEHDCILNSCRWLEKKGFQVTYLDVDEEGFVNPNNVANTIQNDTLLVSIMHANNEIGTIEPIAEIGKICREKGLLFHTDACQSFTKTDLDVVKQNIDLATINSHKIHGPKGVGALYIKEGTKITPLLHGGGHENNLRSGTVNVSGIVGFAKAVELGHFNEEIDRMRKLRDLLIDKLLNIRGTRLNGPTGSRRLCNNVNVTFSGLEGESLLMRLDNEGIYVSTGSACSSYTQDPSHVLSAIGVLPEIIHGSIRFSLSKYTTKEQISYTVQKTKQIVSDLSMISPLVKR